MIQLNVIIPSKIQDYDGEYLYILAPFTDTQAMIDKEITHCEVVIRDGRLISPEQRNKIFALVKDITRYVSGFEKRRTVFEETLNAMQLLYVIDLTDIEEVRDKLTYHYCQLCHIDLFSLSKRASNTIDMSTARDFIDWLVEFCITFGIPCSDTLLNRCEDIQRYLYACIMNRICCICGKSADIHEYDTVGMGRNRNTIHHEGQKVQPLCRAHHNEVGRLGQKTFDKKYHLSFVNLDKKACKKLNWKQ